ncbi:MAG: DUF559 domain-containing protein [Armatimonadetes bacterium]|nr:DUF559 domain-containing protein [Armatimonadota bacterium]
MPDQSDQQTNRARALRKLMPPSQRRLWNALRQMQKPGLRFRRETPIDGNYVDIYCHAARLAIEVDGETHRFIGDRDQARDRRLADNGIETIRVPAAAIQRDVDAIASWIVEVCEARFADGAGLSPSPLARQRRPGPLPQGAETPNSLRPLGEGGRRPDEGETQK